VKRRRPVSCSPATRRARAARQPSLTRTSARVELARPGTRGMLA
jgi:hypothetical protein